MLYHMSQGVPIAQEGKETQKLCVPGSEPKRAGVSLSGKVCFMLIFTIERNTLWFEIHTYIKELEISLGKV